MSDSFVYGRPTIYKGTRMRSRLEAKWAAALDSLGLAWTYEPCAFADSRGQYLPDFQFEWNGRVQYLEVKGAITDHEHIRHRMEIIWSSEPDAHLSLVVGSPRTPTQNYPGALFTLADEWYIGSIGKWDSTRMAIMWQLRPLGVFEKVFDYDFYILREDSWCRAST